MGLKSSPHDPCVFYGQLDEYQPPIYIGLYVNDFKYWSLSDEVEQLFESRLKTHCKVDFMGEVSWFLGCKYEWENLPNGALTVSITQTAKAEEIIQDHGMEDCNPVKSPYRTGINIDRIPNDDPPNHPDSPFVKKYQSVVGCILWLQRMTRPNLGVVSSLLSAYAHKPSIGHYESAKHALAYLKGTLNRGIRYTQEGADLFTETYFPISDGTYTDANWGPQNASKPREGETITLEEVKSILGHVLFRMGGPVMWGCMREKSTVSRSSCESEIYAADEGAKSTLTIRHLLIDLGFLTPNGTTPLFTPLYNDNRGAVDWTKGCTVSKKLRHVNMRKMAVQNAQLLGHISVQHIEGQRNISDLLTKEMKDVSHFTEMAHTITSPRRISSLSFQISGAAAARCIEGGVRDIQNTNVPLGRRIVPKYCTRPLRRARHVNWLDQRAPRQTRQ
jgi:hypothetical protein